MKKVLSRVFSLLMAVMMVMGLSTASFAAPDEAEINYLGKEDGFEFVNHGKQVTDTDLFGNFKNAVPGDKLTQYIRFNNKAKDSDYVVLRMKAVLHDEEKNPVSEEVKNSAEWAGMGETDHESFVKMNEFLSQLNMRVYNENDKLIFDAKANELDGLADFVYLGTYDKGESGLLRAELEIPTSMGNEFAACIGEVDWKFHLEAYDLTDLTISKYWTDGNENHKGEEVEVKIFRNGKFYDKIKLSMMNNWTMTICNLSDDDEWTVEELAPDNCEVKYIYRDGDHGRDILIKNIPDGQYDKPTEEVDKVVKKVWEGKEKHPSFAKIGLFNGEKLVDSKIVNKDNNWTCEWEDLPADGHWMVKEIDIPKGYTPSYSIKDDVIIVTNTATLVETGQMNWPIPVLLGCGVLLIAFGVYMIVRKKKQVE